MARVEKTIFISYRRTNAPWALAIYQNLNNNGYDVFFDFNGIASGDFESVILGNIKARAHFIVLLTPSALERCNATEDWLRREIETALDNKRNIVPLMLEGFDFSTPAIANQLTGKLEALKNYNGLKVPADFFMEAMERLRQKFLNVPLKAVLHPASPSARRVTKIQQKAADTAPSVQEEELTAQQWFERGFDTKDLDEKIRFYTNTIRLKPDYAEAFNSRGLARRVKGDLQGALEDANEAIRLKPDFPEAYNNRGRARRETYDVNGALEDYDEAIRLKPDFAEAFNNRGIAHRDKHDNDRALADFTQVVHLVPNHPDALINRGNIRGKIRDYEGAIQDFNEAIRLAPDYSNAFYNRGVFLDTKGDYGAAIADYQKYLTLGGGLRDGDEARVQQRIQYLKKESEMELKKK